MPQKVLSDEALQHTVNVCANAEGNTAAARTLNLAESTVRRHLEIAAERGIVPRTDGDDEIQLPNFPGAPSQPDQVHPVFRRHRGLLRLSRHRPRERRQVGQIMI